jgi:hypothetical protein
LDQQIENLAFIVNRPPEPAPATRNHGHLVEMQLGGRLVTPAPQFSRNNGPNFKTRRRTVS